MTDSNVDNDVDTRRIDASFELLRHPWRRSLVRYVVRTRTETVTREELVTALLHRTDESVDREHVLTELCHVHLPKMDSLGVIEYEPSAERARFDLESLAIQIELLQATADDLQAELEP